MGNSLLVENVLDHGKFFAFEKIMTCIKIFAFIKVFACRKFFAFRERKNLGLGGNFLLKMKLYH